MSPPLGPQYLDATHTSRSDRRMYLGKCSTLPTQENTTPGRCPDMVSLPGGATPTHHQRWSNPGDCSPAWGTIQHTCRRPLTEYRAHSHEFSLLQGKEWEARQQSTPVQDGSLKRAGKSQLITKVPQSVTKVHLSEPNVSHISSIFTWHFRYNKNIYTVYKSSFWKFSNFILRNTQCYMSWWILIQCNDIIFQMVAQWQNMRNLSQTESFLIAFLMEAVSKTEENENVLSLVTCCKVFQSVIL